MMRHLIALLAIACLSFPAQASDDKAKTRFESANKAYVAKDYKTAATLYEQVISADKIENPTVYLNLGNTYFREGKLGHAVYAYRRGLRLEPSPSVEKNLKKNLETIRTALRAQSKAPKGKTQLTDDESLLYVVTHFLGRELLTTCFLVFWLMFIGILIYRRLRPESGGLGVASITTGLAAFMLGMTLWGQVYSDDSQKVGVVVAEQGALREGPYEKAEGSALPEGAEVRILEGNDQWLRVRLKSGQEGWVLAPEVKSL